MSRPTKEGKVSNYVARLEHRCRDAEAVVDAFAIPGRRGNRDNRRVGESAARIAAEEILEVAGHQLQRIAFRILRNARELRNRLHARWRKLFGLRAVRRGRRDRFGWVNRNGFLRNGRGGDRADKEGTRKYSNLEH